MPPRSDADPGTHRESRSLHQEVDIINNRLGTVHLNLDLLKISRNADFNVTRRDGRPGGDLALRNIKRIPRDVLSCLQRPVEEVLLPRRTTLVLHEGVLSQKRQERGVL